MLTWMHTDVLIISLSTILKCTAAPSTICPTPHVAVPKKMIAVMVEEQCCDSIYSLNMSWLMIDNVMVDVCDLSDSYQIFIAVRQDKISLNRMPMVVEFTQFEIKTISNDCVGNSI